MRNTIALSIMAAALALAGCQEGFFEDDTQFDGGLPTDSAGPCTEGKGRCFGNTYQVCTAGKWTDKFTCKTNETCSATLKRCAQCDPGKTFCKGNDVYSCKSDGTTGAKVKSCGKYACQKGYCTDPCSKAESSRSYVGCHYWPTITSNAGLASDFSFAVVVANTYSKPAKVTISSVSNSNVSSVTVAGNSLATIKLPWVNDLKQKKTATAMPLSVLKNGGAYKLTSDLPVTVYQFNPLDYIITTGDCKLGYDAIPGDGKCYSYSNDASLLLPEHALSKEYMVIARPTMGIKKSSTMIFSPGFMAVTATKAGNTKVSVTFSADTQAGTGGVNSYIRGQTVSFTVPRWGVLQILSKMPKTCNLVKTDKLGTSYCDLSGTTDLTGTIVKADKDVAVFSGHDCTFVPFDKWACDHLEEQMFPTKVWGKRYMGTHTTSSGTDPNVYRVVAADNATKIKFNPAVRGAVTLNKGKWVEFTTNKDFMAEGTGRFALVQYMVGQNYSNATPGKGAPGDPAMALAVPTEQYRTSYRFLAPKNYQQNYVNVITQSPSSIKLDGKLLSASQFKAIGNTGYHVAKLKISGGAHYMEGAAKFGVAVYGVGSYTSYMYPGGLDLKLIY